jgi:lipoprotein Spr
MKQYVPLIVLSVLLVLSSCSSVKKISNKDSNAATTTPKKPRYSGKREFLNGIEVTPGGVVAAKETKSKTANRKAETKTTENAANTKPNAQMMTVGIENANMLQLKYAIATDATVEKMTNIPLLATIDKWWGTKYCMGGSTDNCIDCSAFTQILLRDVWSVNLPRTSQEQYSFAEKIELEDIREGDLVFFNTSGRDISHVGVYLLNNKFVHAATSGGVMISDLNDKYWQPKFRGAGRVIKN